MGLFGNDNTDELYEEALDLAKIDDEECIRCYDKILEIDSNENMAWRGKGLALGRLERSQEAIFCFNKALEIDPPYTLGPLFSGNIYTDAEVYQDKIKEFQKVIKMNREYARAHNYLGLAYLQQKNYLTAKHFLLESIKINPKYAKAHNNLGVLYEQLGETVKAIESYKMAHKVDPNDPDSLFNLGLAYDSLKDGEHSVRYMALAKKAHEKNPSQKGIDRISDKLDQLQAKYADTTANESVASLDSNITGDAGSPALTITNQTSIISPPTLFTPLSQSQTSNSIGSSIAYETPKVLTVNLKPHLDLSTLPINPIAENLQDQVKDESISENSVEELKVAKKDELTAEAGIKESTFTDSRGTYSHPKFSSELQEKVEIASSTSPEVKKKVIAQNPKKKTWVSDWVFDYPK